MRRYNRRLFRIARSVMREDSAAEDVVQETYLRAFTHLDEYAPTGKFGAWLSRIALNEARMLLRKRRTDTVSLDQLDDAAIQAQSSHGRVPDYADALHARQLLERAIDSLPEPYRLVF